MGKRRSLNIVHVNVRSILADTRLFDLERLAASNPVDVLCIIETWLSSSVKTGSSCINLPGFQTPYRYDRASGCRGGGVAIYVGLGLTTNLVKLIFPMP